MRARTVLAIACGAGGGAGRTGIVSSVVELRLPVLSSSAGERAIEGRHHLEEGHFAAPSTCAARLDWRATLSVVFLSLVAIRKSMSLGRCRACAAGVKLGGMLPSLRRRARWVDGA